MKIFSFLYNKFCYCFTILPFPPLGEARRGLLFLSLFLSAAAVAQTVSVETARERAASVLRGTAVSAAKPVRGAMSVQDVQLVHTESSADSVFYYIFQAPQQGFVIVGGDESAKEILGYSTNGAFDADKIPAGLRDMLGVYRAQIAQAMGSAEVNKAKPLHTTAAPTKTSVAPLIKTKWGQNYPFNAAIPTLGDGYDPFLVGCNAVAMAQVMKYYDYAKGAGSKSHQMTYTFSGGGQKTITFSADFGNSTYNFPSMLNVYEGNETAIYVESVAKLMYHAGVAVEMEYGQKGSASYNNYVLPALKENFGFLSSAKYVDRTAYSDEAWGDLMYEEISNGRPVIYRGSSKADGTGGHAFLLHGYDASDNTFTVNWGWAGHCDGNFSLNGTNALNSGTDSGQYCYHNDADIGLAPALDGTKLPVQFYISATNLFTTTKATVSATPAYRGGITYTSTNSDIASVSEEGEILAKAPGTVTITISAAGNDMYAAGSKSFDITVTKMPNSYNASLSFEDLGKDMVNEVENVKLRNSGKSTIIINKILVKDKENDYSLAATFNAGDESLEGGYSMTYSLPLSVLPSSAAYEFFYTYNGTQFIFFSDVNDPDYRTYGDDPTGIENVTSMPSRRSDKIYDLSGRAVGKITKPGLYIIGGKKVIKK